jgi:sigma-E factor negative regulatory protein RseC
MIEERAEVVGIDDDDIWVETQRRSACAKCAVNNGCGTAVLGKVIGVKRSRVRVLNPKNTRVSIGDEIVVGINEQALVRGSLMIYLVPLIFMFLFGLLGEVLSQQLNIKNPDLLAIALGLCGLITGFYLVKRFSRDIRSDSRYQPVLLHRVIPSKTDLVIGGASR